VPKVNVYLPDDLAEGVRTARLPVSAICQRALEEALRSTTALREGATKEFMGLPDDLAPPGPITARLGTAIQLAYTAAQDRGSRWVSTGDLVIGILDEGANLALRVLAALDVEAPDIRLELDAALDDGRKAKQRPEADDPARRAIELMGEEAVRMSHNYLGCEHLLLAVIAEPEGVGGQVLRSMGVDLTVARRAVTTALTGFIHALANPPSSAAPVDKILAAIGERLDRIEAKLSR
jgi:ATP-dependent Clp protease ATP-binding subunit ClpA